ncbi:IQ domain-containing protein C [Conger conger]|uniref:IQ domain-containing protein C n=1 Tax=Conger conger TaxID=82655 RepID=UPI002A59A1F6|nr:IQ domain-containing protein C [Conger conger]
MWPATFAKFAELTAMERQDLERIITDFQARARGFLVRKELGAVRQDYEDVVREIEGDLGHLDWRGGIIAIPLFTKNAFVWQSSNTTSDERSGDACGVSDLTRPLGEPGEGTSPERHQQGPPPDCGQAARGSASPRPAGGDADQSTAELLEGRDPGSRAGEEALVWDRAAVDTAYSFLQKGSPRRSLAKDIPRKQVDLCLHRNNLSMELLWLQQAINSRKKYLLLKQRLGAVE